MPQEKYNGPMRFCHRGLTQAAPENTLPAFQAAVDAGYEGVELDLRMSKEGEIIVCHDHYLARLTCGHPTAPSIRHLKDMTWEELSRVELPYALHTLTEELPAHSEIENLLIQPNRILGDYQTAYKTEPRMAHLLRFVDLDHWMSTLEKKLIVEVEFCEPGMMLRMMEILEASPNCESYILFSGHKDIIEDMQRCIRAHGKPKGLRLGANLRRLDAEAKAYIRDMDLFEVGLNDRQYTRDDVAYLNDRGIQVFSNLGDYPGWWEEMCSNGSLGFKTCYAAAFTKWWYQNH